MPVNGKTSVSAPPIHLPVSRRSMLRILPFMLLIMIACRSNRFSVTEQTGRLQYTSPGKQIRLTFYGDYTFSSLSKKQRLRCSPELATIHRQANAFVAASTGIAPWIQCLGSTGSISDGTVIDSGFVIQMLPPSPAGLSLSPFNSDINGSKAMKVVYKNTSTTTGIVEYFTQVDGQLIRLSFSTPDSTFGNMEKEAAWIFKSLQWTQPSLH